MKKTVFLFVWMFLMLIKSNSIAQTNLLEWRLSQKYIGVALGTNDYLNGTEPTINSNYKVTGVQQSSLLRGAGLNNSKGQANSYAAGFNQTNNTNYDNALTNNNYMEFMVKPEIDYKITLQSLFVRLRSNQGTSSSPLFFQLAYSEDGNSFTPIGSPETIDYSTQTSDFTIDISAIGTITASSQIIFRLCYYRPFTTNTTAYVAIGRRDTEEDTFSSLTVSGIVVPPETLPVNLLSYTAKSGVNGNVLNWSTANEINNDRFEIYRSVNGKDFEQVGVVRGNGTSAVIDTYTFHDNYTGTAYYKLLQFDFNGSSESYLTMVKGSSNDIRLNVKSKDSKLLAIEIMGILSGNAYINIVNVNGQVVYNKVLYSSALTEPIEIDFKEKPGIYIISLQTDQGFIRQKFLR